ERDARRQRRGRDRHRERLVVRQHGVSLHDERRRRATVPIRNARRQRRYQRRRRCADGVLPVLRVEGQLLRRSARPGAWIDRLLQGKEGCGRALADDVVPKILKWTVFVLILAVIGLSIPVVRHLREVPPPPPPALTLTLGAPPGTELGSGDEPLDAAISPDG